MTSSFLNSSSALSDLCKENLDDVRIAMRQSPETSSLLRKINDLSQNIHEKEEENISLRSEIEIMRLEEQEYKQRLNEFDEEIECKAKIIGELSKKIEELEIPRINEKQQFDVKVKMEENQDKFEAKYLKWKEKCKNAKKQAETTNQEYQSKYLAILRENEVLKSHLEENRKTIEFNKELLSKIDNLEKSKKESPRLSPKYDEMANMIKKQNDRIEELIEDNIGRKTQKKQLVLKIKSLEIALSETEKNLNQHELEFEKEKEEYKKMVEQLQNTIHNFESNIEKICGKLGIKGRKWNLIYTKLDNLIEEAQKVESLLIQNGNLEEHNKKSHEQFQKFLKKNEGLIITKEEKEDMISIRGQLKKKEDIIEQLRAQISSISVKRVFYSTICFCFLKLSRDISQLCSSITEHNNTSLKSLINAIISIKRLKNRNEFNQRTASFFNNGDNLMLSSIKERIYSLTNELSLTKQSLYDSTSEKTKLVEHYSKLQIETKEKYIEYEKSRLVYQEMENRFSELQTELSSLVDSADYISLSDEMHSINKENKKIKDTIEKLQNDLKLEQSKLLESLEKIKQLSSENNIQRETIIQCREEIKEKEGKIREISILLSEKSKEMVSLERHIQRNRSQKVISSNQFENTSDVDISSVVIEAPINPAFLEHNKN